MVDRIAPEHLQAVRPVVMSGVRELPELVDQHELRLVKADQSAGDRRLQALDAQLLVGKPPLSNYNIVPIKGEVMGIRTWKSQKAELRPGDAAFTASLLAGIEIDQISFAGGTVGSSVQRIAAAARQRLALSEEELVSEIERRRQTGGR